MAKIIIEISLTKYLLQMAKYYGLEEVYISKVKGGVTYISDGKPYIGDDKEDIDFEAGWTLIPKDFSKHIPLKAGESKLATEVIKEIKKIEKEKA